MMAELSEEQPAKAAVPIDCTDLSDIHTWHGQHTLHWNHTIVTVPCMYSMSDLPRNEQRGQSGSKESRNPDGCHPPGKRVDSESTN